MLRPRPQVKHAICVEIVGTPDPSSRKFMKTGSFVGAFFFLLATSTAAATLLSTLSCRHLYIFQVGQVTAKLQLRSPVSPQTLRFVWSSMCHISRYCKDISCYGNFPVQLTSVGLHGYCLSMSSIFLHLPDLCIS